MLDWLLNRYDIGYWAWVIFTIGLICSLAFGIAAGLRAMWEQRERRDQKKP